MVIIAFRLICQEFFNYCIQKFEIEEDTVESCHFESPVFYQKILLFQRKHNLDKISHRVVRLFLIGHKLRIGYKIEQR